MNGVRDLEWSVQLNEAEKQKRNGKRTPKISPNSKSCWISNPWANVKFLPYSSDVQGTSLLILFGPKFSFPNSQFFAFFPHGFRFQSASSPAGPRPGWERVVREAVGDSPDGGRWEIL